MSIDLLAQSPQPRLAEIDTELAAMMKRVRVFADGDALDNDRLGELVAIYNNVAYLFLYLESNAAHVDWRPLERWKHAFYADEALNKAIVQRLAQARLEDRVAESTRTAYLRFFEGRSKAAATEWRDERNALLAQAQDVSARVRLDQERLLLRLGTRGGGSPEATYYNLISTTQSAATREKLARAWRRVRDEHSPLLEAIVDKLIALRHSNSKARGFENALGETLQRSRLNETHVEAFIADYLEQSLEYQDRLDHDVRLALGVVDAPMHHFEYYVRRTQSGEPVPLFSLERCLDFAFDIAKAVLGLEFHRAPEQGGNVIRVEASRQGQSCGVINFDLWQSVAPKPANTTIGARNRMDWAGCVQLPVAYVSCRFRRRDEQGSDITFQNVHSLFHEFGHAINHLLITRTIPSESGLEYLPIERLETLSMWFEKWVFHPSFAISAAAGEDDSGIRRAQAIKRLEYRRTHVDRAVTAALDFEVSKCKGSVRNAFEALDRRFRISRHCALEDFLGYFTLPMLDANPGGYFAYLWSAAESAEMFALWRSHNAEEWPSRARASEIFAPFFDFDAPSLGVAPGAAFSFYEPETAPW
jgi:oligopeptidase A